MAEGIIAIRLHLIGCPAALHPVSAPASKQLLLSAPGFPLTSLAALLSLLQMSVTQSSALVLLFSISIQPLGESLQFPSFQHQR